MIESKLYTQQFIIEPISEKYKTIHPSHLSKYSYSMTHKFKDYSVNQLTSQC